MRLQRCSKTDFRKSRRRILAGLLVLVSSVLPAELANDGTVEVSEAGLSVSMTVSGADRREFFRNLDDGLTARLQFRVRVSEPRPAPLALLGHRFLAEFALEHDASWDPFRRAYVLSGPGEREALFDEPESLWRHFLMIDSHTIAASELPDGSLQGSPIVEIRVSYRPIVFVPALGMLSVFLSEDREATGWERVALVREGD